MLDFKGRITMSSVKNFQLGCENSGDEIILQFGRISCQPPGPYDQCKCHKDTFNMDFKVRQATHHLTLRLPSSRYLHCKHSEFVLQPWMAKYLILKVLIK